MTANLRYHFPMSRLKQATVAGFAILCVALTLTSAGFAQINGVPASVTSLGFGGHPGPHGVPPSLTSIGPRGLVPNNQFPTPGICCINPLFPSNPNPRRGHPGREHHRHNQDQGYYGGYSYAVPYAVPYYAEDVNADSSADDRDDQYDGGPTVFDRRGPGQPAPYPVSQYTAPPAASLTVPSSAEPASDQPQTLLVFKDGHQIEVSNYAIVGSMLYDLTPGHSRKVPLADLNLGATTQQNDDRGIDFALPWNAAAN